MTPVSARPLLSLLHLCDSLFPTGGFSQSDGLESATSAGLIGSGDDLRDWMHACLHDVVGCCDGPIVRRAWEASAHGDWAGVELLDAEAYAMRPAATSRQAS